MDQSLLVKYGQHLVSVLDDEGIKPIAAVWYFDTSIEDWRLWIVPTDPELEKREFYSRVGACLRAYPSINLEISDIQMMSASHQGIVGLSRMSPIQGPSSVHLSNNMANGFFILEGIVLRMVIKQASEAAA